MAIMIPEAAGAVEGGEAAIGARAAGARAGAGRHRAPGGSTKSRVQQGRERRGAQQARQQQFGRSARRAGRGALKARLPGSHTYQPVILAEFVVAIVIVSVSPVAKGGTQTAQAKASPSPYSTDTLKQLVAIGLVYFVLALLAASRRAGRFAAWFGALVLLGLGLAEFASGDLAAIFGIFKPPGTSKNPADTGTSPQVAIPIPVDVVPTPGGEPSFTQQVTGQGGALAAVYQGGPGVVTTDGIQLA
jgi:hypothetical protein